MIFKNFEGYSNDCIYYSHDYLISCLKSVWTMNTKNITYRLALTAKEHNNSVALSFLRNGKVETELTFRQLQVDINQLASEFKDLGVNQGDRVVIFIPKSVFAIIAHFAIQTIGAISVPLNPGLTRTVTTISPIGLNTSSSVVEKMYQQGRSKQSSINSRVWTNLR